MVNESFERLHNYKSEDSRKLVNESLEADFLFEDDDFFSKLFTLPLKSMRKSFIKKNGAGYQEKKTLLKDSKSAIKDFYSSTSKMIDKIVKQYQAFKKNKLQPLLNDDKDNEASELISDQIKELETWRNNQLQSLEKTLDEKNNEAKNRFLEAISGEGYFTGKAGELTPKQKRKMNAWWSKEMDKVRMAIEEFKTDEVLKSDAWKKFDAILAEMNSFSKETAGGGTLELFVQDIVPTRVGYRVLVHIRSFGKRYNLKEKGIVIGTDPGKMELGPDTVAQKVLGRYQFSLNSYELLVKDVPKGDVYVRPYLILKEKKDPVYGDTAYLNVREKSKEEKKTGATVIKDKPSPENSKPLAGEERDFEEKDEK
jgi:hypothetical protein